MVEVKLFNWDNISFSSAPVNIEGCIFVISLSTNAWRSCRNCSSANLLLWNFWELTNSVLILLSSPFLPVDLNSAGTLFSFSLFMLYLLLGFILFCLKVWLVFNFIFDFSVGFYSAFLALWQSDFFIHLCVFFQKHCFAYICYFCIL